LIERGLDEITYGRVRGDLQRAQALRDQRHERLTRTFACCTHRVRVGTSAIGEPLMLDLRDVIVEWYASINANR